MAITAAALAKPIEKILDAIKSLQGVSADTKTANQALISNLKEMESAYIKKQEDKIPDYESMLPKSVNTELKAYEEKSENELLAEARSAVISGIEEKAKKLNETTDSKLYNLENKLLTKGTDLTQDADKLERNFSTAEQNTAESAVRQGIAVSSIYDEAQKNLYDNYLAGMDSIRTEYQLLEESITREMTALDSARQEALMGYDLSAAAEIEKKLAALRNEQQSAINAVNKYNQTVVKAQEDREAALATLKQDWINSFTYQLRNETIEGYTGENAVEMAERYNTAKEFYFSLNKADAKKLLSQNASELTAVLGSYYMQLLRENENR